jgi:hypothetical protein
MGIFTKLVTPADQMYMPVSKWSVQVRPSGIMAAVVTDTPENQQQSTPMKDMQEVYVIVQHFGHTNDISAKLCGIQVVRQNQGQEPEALFEMILEIGSDGAPLRLASKFEIDPTDQMSPAVDRGLIPISNGLKMDSYMFHTKQRPPKE